MANMTFKASLLPNTSNTYSLGSSSQRWENIYGDFLFAEDLQLTGELNVTGNSYLHNQTLIDNATLGNLIVSGATNFVQSPTAPTPTAGDASTKLATTEFVTGAVTDLAGPMRFIGSLGTGGTATTLPAAAAANKGHTYKVITADTYQGVAAKIGDLLISNGSSWVLIPSGDEPVGTVTNIATGSGLTGGPITGSGTISHADTSTQASITANGRKYITGVTLDGFGHVTGLTTGDITAAVERLDVAAIGGGTGEYISQISETDGKISATKTTTSVSNTWEDGTTAGPKIKTTVNGITGQAFAIPSATDAASGVVTTTTQTFAGAKTFTNAAAFNATGNSTHSKDTNAAVVVKGGVSVEKQISARTVRVDGTSTDNSNTTPGGVSLQYDSTLQVLNFVFS